MCIRDSLIGNAVDEVIDNLLAVIRQGVACVILLARFFQPAGAFQLGKILLYGEIVHIVFFQKELANFAIREGNSHFLQEMQNNQLMLRQLFCGILHLSLIHISVCPWRLSEKRQKKQIAPLFLKMCIRDRGYAVMSKGSSFVKNFRSISIVYSFLFLIGD